MDINNLVQEIRMNEGFIPPQMQSMPLLKDVYTVIQEQFKKGDDVEVWDLVKTKVYLNAIYQNQIKFIEKMQANQKQDLEYTLNYIKQKDEKTLLHDIATILSETDRKYQPWSQQRGHQLQCHNKRQKKDKQVMDLRKEKYLKNLQKNTIDQVTKKIKKFKNHESNSDILEVIEKGMQFDKNRSKSKKSEDDVQLNSMNLWTLAQILDKQKSQIQAIMTNHSQINQMRKIPSEVEHQFNATQKSWENNFAKSDKNLQEYTGQTVSMNSFTKSKKTLNQKSHPNMKLSLPTSESQAQGLNLFSKPLISPLSFQNDQRMSILNTNEPQSHRNFDPFQQNRVQSSDSQFSKTLSNLKKLGNNQNSQSYVNIQQLKNQSIRQKNINDKKILQASDDQSAHLSKDFVFQNQVSSKNMNEKGVGIMSNVDFGCQQSLTDRIQIFDIINMNPIDVTQTQNGTLVDGDRFIDKKDRKGLVNQSKFDTLNQKHASQQDIISNNNSNSNVSQKNIDIDLQDFSAYNPLVMHNIQPYTQRTVEIKEPLIEKHQEPLKQIKNIGKLVSGFKFLTQKSKGLAESHDNAQIQSDIQISKSINLQQRNQKQAELRDIKIGDFSQMNKLRKLIKQDQSKEDSKENEPAQGFSIQFDECKYSLEGAQVSEYKILVQNDDNNILNEDILGSPVKNVWRRSMDDSKILGSLDNIDNDQDIENTKIEYSDDPTPVKLGEKGCSPLSKTRQVSARSPSNKKSRTNMRNQHIMAKMNNQKNQNGEDLQGLDLESQNENDEKEGQDSSDMLMSSLRNQRISSGRVRTYGRLVSAVKPKLPSGMSSKQRPKTGSKKSKIDRSNETTPSIPQNLQNNIYLYQKNSSNFKYAGRSPSANKSPLKTNNDLNETWNQRRKPLTKAGSKETNNNSRKLYQANSKGSSVNKLTNFDKKSSSINQNSKTIPKSAISKSSYSINHGENEVRMMESKINLQATPPSHESPKDPEFYPQGSDQFDGTILELTKEHTLEEITQMHLSQISPDKMHSPEHNHQNSNNNYLRDSLNKMSDSKRISPNRKNSRILVQKDYSSQNRSKEKSMQNQIYRKSFDYLTQTDQTQKLESNKKSSDVDFQVEEGKSNNQKKTRNYQTQQPNQVQTLQSSMVVKKEQLNHQSWNNVNPSNISAKIITKSQSGERIGQNPTMSQKGFGTGKNSRPQSSRYMDLGIQSSLKIQGIKKERKKLSFSNTQKQVIVSAEQIYSSKKINFSPQLTQSQENLHKNVYKNQQPLKQNLNDSQQHNQNILESNSNLFSNQQVNSHSLLHNLQPGNSDMVNHLQDNPQIVIYSSPKAFNNHQNIIPSLQIPIDQIDLFNKQIKAHEDIWIEAALEDMSIKKLVQRNDQQYQTGRKSHQRGLQKGISLCTSRTNKATFCSPGNITQKGASRKELDLIQSATKPMQVRQSVSRERGGEYRSKTDNKLGQDLQVVNFSQNK